MLKQEGVETGALREINVDTLVSTVIRRGRH